MNNCFIILAGGESKRFNSRTPKLYHLYRGKPLILHSINKLMNYKNVNKIVVVINKKHKIFWKKLNIKNVMVLEGGKTRAESSFKALKAIKNYNVKNVLIHDAARPNFSIKLLDRIIKELKFNQCVVPMIKTNDSVKLKNKDKIINLKRENIYLTQTPQAFRFNEIFKLQIIKAQKLLMMQTYL